MFFYHYLAKTRLLGLVLKDFRLNNIPIFKTHHITKDISRLLFFWLSIIYKLHLMCGVAATNIEKKIQNFISIETS